MLGFHNRLDYKIIHDLIEEKSSVLDLGCGDGSLLSLLIEKKMCTGTGIEINEESIYECMENGITVSHDDIDTSLPHYSENKFDYIILNDSLQQVLNPEQVILESFRVAKKVLVGIPNFCYITARVQIFFQGRVPVTPELPHQWFDTPNLRFLSLKDFRYFCKNHRINILKEVGIKDNKKTMFRPNLFAKTGLFLLEKK